MDNRQELIQIYEKAFERVKQRIIKHINDKGYHLKSDVSILKDINYILNNLMKEISIYDGIIEEFYHVTRLQEIEQLKKLGVDFETDPNFTKVHAEAVDILFKRYKNEQYKIITGIYKDARNKIEVINKQLGIKLETATITPNEFNVLLKDLSGFYIPVGARVMNAIDYVKTSVDTNIDSARNKALINTALESGTDLVKMSYHINACSKCAPYENKVYSITGKSKKYPPLSSIRSGAVTTFGVIHPRCRHRFTAFYEGLSTTQKKTQSESDRLEFERNHVNEMNRKYREKNKKQKKEIISEIELSDKLEKIFKDY
jgi:hypothetical protein